MRRKRAASGPEDHLHHHPSAFRPTLGGRTSPSRQGLSRQLAQKLAQGDPSRRYRSGSSERSAPDRICDLCRCGARFSLIESHAPNAGCIAAANFGELAGRVGRGSRARSYPGRPAVNPARFDRGTGLLPLTAVAGSAPLAVPAAGLVVSMTVGQIAC